MARFFTLSQAQKLLPDVAEAIETAIQRKHDFEQAEAELQSANERIAAMGGSWVDRDRLLASKNRRQSSAVELKQAFDRIESYGCLVKDMDIGLIDFPTLYRGEEVYLCWKLGEDDIEFWHGVTEGFRGRKRIEAEFLENHKGDPTN